MGLVKVLFLYIYIYISEVNKVHFETIYYLTACFIQTLGLSALIRDIKRSEGVRYLNYYYKRSRWLKLVRQRGDYGFGLAFLAGAGVQRSILVLCLQAAKNSDLQLILAPSSLNIMNYFSLRQRRHISVTGLKGLACTSCLNLREYWIFWSFSIHICFDKHVAVLLNWVSVLKFCLWLAYLSFQLGWLSPV